MDPRGVLNFDKDVSSNIVKANITRFKKEKDKKGMIITQGANYQATNNSNRDMEFLALLQYARDCIITVFGVPPAKVGIIETGNIGTGTGESQDKNFAKVINGNCRVIEDAFNKNLGRSGFEEIFEFVREDHEDKQKRAEIEDKQLRNGTTFINEVRSGYGLDPVEWGNVPMNYSQFALAASPEQLDESRLIQPDSQVKMLEKALLSERYGNDYGSEERIKTNLILMDSLDYWEELTLKAIDDEETLRYYNLLTTLINTQLENGIKWLKSDEARRYFFNEAAYEKEIFEKLESQWDRILSQKYETIEDLLEKVYDYGKAQGYSDMRSRIRYTDTDKLALTHVRNYNFGLIRKLDGELRRAIKNKIFKGVIGGENPRKLAPKLVNLGVEPLPNSTLSPTQRATMIARTEVARAQNTGILQSYVNEGYTEVKILTAEDDNVCYLCLRNAYEFNEDDEIIYANHGDERVHNIKDLINKKNWVPLHPNCRCTYLSIWDTKGEPPKNPYTINLTDNNVHNWSYQHKGGTYAFQGNTPIGRDDFLERYGVDLEELNKDENKKEKLFLQILTKDAWPLNTYLRKGKVNKELYSEKWNQVNNKLIDEGILSEDDILSFDDAVDISEYIFEKYSKLLMKILFCAAEK